MSALKTGFGTAVLTASMLVKALIFHFETRMDTVCVFGAPGIGKTEIVKQVAALLGFNIVIMHPQIADPTDFKGMPAVIVDDETGKRVAVFLPFAELKALVEADSPTIAFLDDFGQAPRAVQAAIQQLILERRVDGRKISDNVRFCLAANRAEDKAGVDQGFLTTIKTRCTLYTLEPTVDDYCKWAIENDYRPECVSFVRFMGMRGLWARHDPEFRPSYGTDNEVCPRTVTKSFDQYQDGIPSGLEIAMLQGNTNSGWATTFMAYTKSYHALPNMDLIYSDPSQFTPPDASQDPSVLYAVTAAIAAHATTKNAAKFFQLIEKLPADFRVAAVKDAYTRDKAIANTNGFVKWVMENGDVINA